MKKTKSRIKRATIFYTWATHPLVLFLTAYVWLLCSSAFAASVSSALLKAKQQAESQRYVFIDNHDEIVSKAKKEGKLHVQNGFRETLRASSEAFRKRYPFIDLAAETVRGVADSQRILLELKAGVAKDRDILRTHADIYSQWEPYLWKIDILGMAEHGVVDINPKMIDPQNRNVIALGSRFAAVAYNKTLVSPSQLPRSWEDMLKPEWKGRKFGVDVNPQEIAGLVPVWGLEKTLDYARKLAAQQPIWSYGGTRSVMSVALGQIPLFLFGANYNVVRLVQRKDPLGVLQYSIVEPVPLRVTTEQAIASTSRNVHAALLWLEFMVSAEAQKLIDEHEPFAASLYRSGSFIEQELRNKRLSVIDWRNNEKAEQWLAKIVEALGFPKAN
jgi:iron(III) transport system substrate-binding protein